MPKNLVIFPYSLQSDSATIIANHYGVKKVKPDGIYTPQPNDLILNWGMSETPNWAAYLNGAKIINHWDNLKVSVNKLKTFQKLKSCNVNVPMFSTNLQDAKEWLQNGDIIVCRKILCGSKGDGITICKTIQELEAAAPETKMFVRYFKRKNEYRVFIANNEIFDYSEKKKKIDYVGESNVYIRNLENGYAFCREDVVLPEVVKQQSLAAAKALELDITAIDIGYNESCNLAIVFEANSSFAFDEGTTTFESVIKIIDKWLGVEPAQIPAPTPVTSNPFNSNNQNISIDINMGIPKNHLKFNDIKNIELVIQDGKAILYGLRENEIYPSKLVTVGGQFTIKQHE